MHLTRGCVRAGPSLQLRTLSTRRIELYTRRWRASPGVLKHAGRAHILGPGGPLPHAKNEVDRTTLSGDMAKPSADRLTRDSRHATDRHDLPTNQPAVFPVPSCKLEICDVACTLQNVLC